MKKRFILFIIFVSVISLQIAFAQVRLSAEEAEKLITVKPFPVFSDFAKQMKAQGNVKIELTVSENGTVSKVLPFSGNPSLLSSAVATGKKYQFKPYVFNGKATAFVTTLEIFFTLGSTKEEVKNEEETAGKYYAQSDKCRALMKERKWKEAEQVCKLAVLIAEKLPENRAMEKHSAYIAVSYTLLYLKQHQASIEYSNKALNVTKDQIDESDSETGEIYFLLGAANHNLWNLDKASEYFTKAEETYRRAFDAIDDDEIRQPYPQMIKNILQSHLVTAEEAGDKNKIEAIKKRLSELKRQYSKFL